MPVCSGDSVEYTSRNDFEHEHCCAQSRVVDGRLVESRTGSCRADLRRAKVSPSPALNEPYDFMTKMEQVGGPLRRQWS